MGGQPDQWTRPTKLKNLPATHLAMNSDFQKNPKFQGLARVTYNHFGEGL